MLTPVIMAGGSGTRLWPLSRRMLPKQFLPLAGSNSMLQETLLRLDGINRSPAIVVCNEEHRFLVAEQLLEIGETGATIILEPVGRNTAPAIAVAAIQALKQDIDAQLLVLAADHIIAETQPFYSAVQHAEQLAMNKQLVTFGVVPTAAETGYGYIKRGDSIGPGYKVSQFVEKPELDVAKEYLASGEYYWNSGMFLFHANHYLEELGRFQPEILDTCREAVEQGREDLDFFRLDIKSFSKSPSNSIDYAVMEKTDNAVVVPLDASWNDVGSWSALWDIGDKDDGKNVLVGDVLTVESSGCYARADTRLMALIGVEDLVVVDTSDAVMVARLDRVQEVKQVVDRLNEKNRPEAVIHREVYRPWGKYDSIDMGERFHVKRITVNPGESLSLQQHHHRSEHWIVVSGTAEITRNEEVFILAENQSTYIPLGAKHRLSNPGKIPLEMIEVQSGAYLGEDDIVRFKDEYGR